jgi:hypothetical protein
MRSPHASLEKISFAGTGAISKNRRVGSCRNPRRRRTHHKEDRSMNAPSPCLRFACGIAGSALSLASVFAAPPGSVSAGTVTVAVYSDRYVTGGVAFDDIALVESHVTEAHPRRVALVICDPKATRALKAAVHRFRHLPVTMRPAEDGDAACRASAPVVTQATQRSGPRPYGIDDDGVDRYWLELMP